ncbi:hypothetical protein AB4Y42_40360 [Paraburkholderia sp. EG286B]|uniref:DUF6841 family protein n=1 Tax=Paraburkholderia sp. EG286B TaxID=3237011 RepID=UPI0034D36945
MSHESNQLEENQVLAEVWRWFFDSYLPRWVTAGERGEDASFITDYWGAPLWVSIDDIPPVIATTKAEVVEILRPIHTRLRSAGYSHTAVPDRRAIAFNSNSAQISVIWSRRRSDESEIERCAVNFNLMRLEEGWRIVHIQQKTTTAPDLTAMWLTHQKLA